MLVGWWCKKSPSVHVKLEDPSCRKSSIKSIGPGVSSVAKGYSNYVDSMLDNRMSQAFKKVASLEVKHKYLL